MPRKFDKKNAKTFELVHRSHDDAHFFDDDVTSHVLVEKPLRKPKVGPEAIVTKRDLESQLEGQLRGNEGQAAQYGIFYDDSKYDYMQHLKPIGEGDLFIENKPSTEKSKLKIEDLFDKTQLPDEKVRSRGFQPRNDIYEDIPQELKGFQPDMDPRLREVLEALEDEAYVEEESNALFDDLLKSGKVEDDDYDEWDDEDEFDYEADEYDFDAKYHQEIEQFDNPYNEGEAPEDFDPELMPSNTVGGTNDWQRDFAEFKRSTKQHNDWDSDDDFDEEEENENDAVGELPTIPNKKVNKTKLRKKKGAMTDTSLFSMLSLALFRTEGLALLDDRFEKINKDYENENEEEEYKEFNMDNERGDLEEMLDDFLDNYELEGGGRRLVKKDEELTKIKQAAQLALRSNKKRTGVNDAFSKLSLKD